VDEATSVESITPTERFRRLVKAAVLTGVSLFFNDRKLYDIAAFAASERWPCTQFYEGRIQAFVTQIISDGRELGEFERKTPLDETVGAICLALRPYINPLLLQYSLDGVEEMSTRIANLVLRSLMP
jgi:hypothetical protein